MSVLSPPIFKKGPVFENATRLSSELSPVEQQLEPSNQSKCLEMLESVAGPVSEAQEIVGEPLCFPGLPLFTSFCQGQEALSVLGKPGFFVGFTRAADKQGSQSAKQ